MLCAVSVAGRTFRLELRTESVEWQQSFSSLAKLKLSFLCISANVLATKAKQGKKKEFTSRDEQNESSCKSFPHFFTHQNKKGRN